MRIYLHKNCFQKHKLPPVPWDWGSALLIGFLFLFMPSLLLTLIHQIPMSQRPSFLIVSESNANQEFSSENQLTNSETSEESDQTDLGKKDDSSSNAVQRAEAQKLGSEHPLTELLIRSRQTNQYYFIVCLCFLTAVIVAPITEEFVFRVVLQRSLEPFVSDSLEKKDFSPDDFSEITQNQPSFEIPAELTKCHEKKRSFLFRTLMIGLPAFLFALIHYRSPNEIRDMNFLLLGIFISPIANILVLLLGTCWLKFVYKVHWSDFGISIRTIPQDIFNGVIAFLMILPVLIVVRIQMVLFFPNIVTDPAPIFVFAIALGLLYERTGRFVSVVAMHAALNFCSFLMILLV